MLSGSQCAGQPLWVRSVGSLGADVRKTAVHPVMSASGQERSIQRDWRVKFLPLCPMSRRPRANRG
jgi:hypothetical protein